MLLGACTEYAILIVREVEQMAQEWYIKAKKKLIEMNMSQKDLANAINVNYCVLCSVLNGKTLRKTVKDKICEYLKI